MSRRVRVRWSVLLLTLPLLGGCGRSMDELEQWVAEVKSRRSTSIAPIPQIKPYEAFVYDIAGRRDPFIAVEPQRTATTVAGTGPQPDFKRPKEALEEYPLDALRMQGTIRTSNAVYALVKAPDGVIHRVGIGAHMGQNFGQIKSITDQEIALSELVADGFGGWLQRAAVLALTQ
ncbi:type IV pilus assembly protein PilP [Hydrocarboniphaga daqingensis]|uniref:Type IV pilus assembly protein PilP n=1 Tax=Hydrocarboniphaga daqingensis TaxID=490188 RepID=A0A1M5L9J7_9GAMM|nr:pilus assembly protein PilP [Hydrocarboniphaga daqingensis]SHG61804.1 type IV pilus assembly protein PilP [Hydrocarboniphaga daqingensis]